MIQNNTIHNFYTIFIDSTSSYLENDAQNNTMSHNTISYVNNDENTCTNGIFIENKTNSQCLYGKQCIGLCCNINDMNDCVPIASNANEVDESEPTGGYGTYVKTLLPQAGSIATPPPDKTPSSSKEVNEAITMPEAPTTGEQEEGCGKACIIVATVIPIVGILLSIGIIVFIKRRSRRNERINFFTRPHEQRRGSDLPDFDSMEFM